MMRFDFTCDYCRATASAKAGELPRGWHAHGPSEEGTRYPSIQTVYFCNATHSLAWSEMHTAALIAEEQIG